MKRVFSIFIFLCIMFSLSILFSCKKEPDVDEFKLKAIINEIYDDRIEAEVIESDYAFGVYWALTSDITEYYDSNDTKIDRDSLMTGDTIEITYNGQTMMSYPPQIVSLKIVRLEKIN